VLLKEQAIAYISRTIDEDWVVSGVEAYANFPEDVKKLLEIIIPSNMSVDFYLGIAHAASASSAGARVCHAIQEISGNAEFIEKVNKLAENINKEGL
jgi:hypothetical protein